MKIKELFKRKRKPPVVIHSEHYSSNFGKQRSKPQNKMIREHSDK